MNIRSYVLLFVVLISLIGLGSAADDGNITRVSPVENISISEGDSQIFSILVNNTDPTNQTYTIKWYVDGIEKQSTTTNATSDTYTLVTDSSDSGIQTITATSSGAASDPISWTVSISNIMFLGISEVIIATIGILSGIISLIVGGVIALIIIFLIVKSIFFKHGK